MPRAINIAMLLSDGFGGFGGISRFNRDFLMALGASPAVNRIHASPRVISDPIEETIPENLVYHREAARGKIAYLRHVLARTWADPDIDLVICGHLNLLPAASLMSRYRRARLALVIHGIEAWQPPTHGVAGAMVNRVDAFIAVSRHSAERFLSWSKLPARRGHVLPNCVDLEYFKPQARDERLAARYGLRSSTVIMTLGRLAPQERYKGFDEILEIMPRLLAARPNLKYLIVGDGPDRARLAAKSQALGVVGNVVFAGRIEEREKVAHYSLADAYVMPSSGEGFGIVLIEAAACGIPVIGSAVDGSREALLDGRLGGMVDPRNPDELVASILEVLAEERPRRRPPEVEIFGVGHFRARVDDWVRAQAALGLSQRSSVSPISAAPNANSPISNDVG